MLHLVELQVELLRNSLTRTRIKVSAAVGNLKTYFDTYVEYDPLMVPPQPSNPWSTDDSTFWQLNNSLLVHFDQFFSPHIPTRRFFYHSGLFYFFFYRVEVPTEKRVKRWALSMEEIMSDPTGNEPREFFVSKSIEPAWNRDDEFFIFYFILN